MSSWQKPFGWHLILLRFVGILPARLCSSSLVMTNGDVRRAIWTTALILFIFEGFLIETILLAFERAFNLYGSSKTGNTLVVFQLISCAVIQLAVSITFFMLKHRHIHLLDVICRHARQLPQSATGEARRSIHLGRRLRLMFVFNTFLFLIFEWNTAKILLMADDLPLAVIVCCLVILSIHFGIASIVLSNFGCIVLILRHILVNYNERLRKIKCSNVEIKHILSLRAELISLCSTHLSLVYGLVMLFESFYILCTSPACPFLISMIAEWQLPVWTMVFEIVLRSILLVFPPVVIFIKIFVINSVTLEANKTVKILSKVPRTGTGIEKMVEKFLLKNLRQKPILTAYGFFSLDKSTLFQLFTAIFTYMVILVQFKEMESSTKQISET